MNTTLIVENNSQLQDFYAINLHTWVGSKTIAKNDAKFSIEYLNENLDSINLIICKAKIGTEKTAEAIFQFLLDKALDIPLLVIGDSPLASKGITHIFSALSIKEIVRYAASELGITAQDMANLSVPDYFEIPIQNFYFIQQPICDVYNNNDDNVYKLYLSAHQEINQNEIKKMDQAGTRNLFVKKNDRLKFVTNIGQEIASKLVLDELNEDEQMSAVEMSQKLLQAKLTRMGITDQTVALAQKNLIAMAKTAKKIPGLKELLARLAKNKMGYLFKHSQILMYVSTHLMNQLDWVNDEQRKKLQFIAFFHDIALENSEQAMIHTTEELRKSNLSDSEKEIVKKHAQVAADLANKYPNAPVGVGPIIKQHHGMTNGLGFSEHYSQNISPMAIVFILSEDYVDGILRAGPEFSAFEHIRNMRKKYSTQRFKKIIDALESLVL